MIANAADNSVMDDWLGRNLRRATSAVFNNFGEEFAQFKIRPALFAVLTLIESHPGSSGARLSELLEIPRANMVLLLRELEQRHLIEREPDPANRRAHIVLLTPQGAALMPKLHAAQARHNEHTERWMTPEERRFLIALLQRIWRRAGEIEPGL